MFSLLKTAEGLYTTQGSEELYNFHKVLEHGVLSFSCLFLTATWTPSPRILWELPHAKQFTVYSDWGMQVPNGSYALEIHKLLGIPFCFYPCRHSYAIKQAHAWTVRGSAPSVQIAPNLRRLTQSVTAKLPPSICVGSVAEELQAFQSVKWFLPWDHQGISSFAQLRQ